MTGLFFGLATVDLQFLVSTYPVSNSKVKALENGIYAGGPATNAAIGFSYTGGIAKLHSIIGNHPLREFMIQDITSNGVTVTDLLPGEQINPVIAGIVTTKSSGERTIFSYHPNIDITNGCFIEPDLQGISISMFDGFYLDAAIWMAEKMKNRHIPVVLDGGSWKKDLDGLLPFVDIAICSNDFYAPGTSKPKEVIEYLKSQQINYIAITRGDKPIMFDCPGQKGEIYIHKTDVVDTLGAGDFFHGAFCYYYAQDNNFTEALRKASEVAKISCTAFGTRDWMK